MKYPLNFLFFLSFLPTIIYSYIAYHPPKGGSRSAKIEIRKVNIKKELWAFNRLIAPLLFIVVTNLHYNIVHRKFQ